MEEEKEPLTTDDLARVYIRAKMPDGRYASIHCAEASDEQFDTWAKSQVTIQGESGPWSLIERTDFCNRLWMGGALHMLKKDVE